MSEIKVIVVEDEPAILRGIVRLIENISEPMEIVGTYMSGIEAIAEFDIVNPDIVVTDVQMPLMSGLELIEKIKQSGHQVESLILSGYSEFEYLQGAIQLSVSNYLLKPPKKEELEDFFTGACRRIERRRCEKFRKELEDLLVHGYSSGSLAEQENGNYSVCVVMMGFYLEWETKKSIYGSFTWKALLEEQNYWSIQGYYPNMMIIVSLESANLAYMIYNRLKEKAREKNCCLSVVGSKRTYKVKELKKQVQKSVQILQQKMEFGKDKIIMMEETGNIFEDEKEILPIDDMELLHNLIKLGEGKNVEKQYIRFAEKCIKSKVSGAYFYQITKQIIYEICAEMKRNGGMNIGEDAKSQIAGAAFEADCYEQFVENSTKIIRELYSGLRYSDEGDYHIKDCIEKLEKIICDGIGKDIDINRFAKENGYHPVYLITQFSKRKGISPTKLLIQLRMEYACKLLTVSDISIKKISEMVGYKDVPYFSRAFKEYMGVSPGMYRKKVANAQE